MDLRVVRYEVDRGVGLVTLDRPDRMNAWTVRMEREYAWALHRADRDPDVRVVVVTGAGRGFCVGADFKALDVMSDTGSYDVAGERPADEAEVAAEHAPTLAMRLSKPVIAAVNGPAAGVGFVLICFADIRFAAVGAKLTTSFGRLGLPAEHGVSWLLSRLVGPGRAADLLFSSRVILAEEAVELGLVNRALPPDELMPFTLDYARRMAAEISPSSLRVMKRQLWDDMAGEVGPSVKFAVEVMERMVGEPDFAEGVAAFQARRPPAFGASEWRGSAPD
jgi:enoyl-CoA hydratase/carnithine racemase